jgi:hypothetical protein
MSMRKYFFLLAMFWGLGGVAEAQSFFPVGAATFEQELAWNEANECYLYFQNPSGDSLRLRWRRLELSLPEGWVADFCDYGLCYTGVPANGTMNMVYDTIQPYLKMIVQPGSLPGSAWAWFRVFELEDDSNFQDVFFSLRTPGTVSAQTPSEMPLRVFPNPAKTFLTLENEHFSAAWTQVFNLAGQLVWAAELAPGTRQQIQVEDWPNGLYFLRTPHANQRIVISK